jgi:Zn-dependent membrane protease YugP
MIWIWDDPYNSLLVYLYVMLSPLQPVVPGLVLAIWARRQSSRVAPAAGEVAIDGAGLASAILGTIGESAPRLVPASGPLANFYDPWKKELRLSEAVSGGRDLEALGVAAHEAGHALQDVRWPWISRLRPPLALGARLAGVVAGMALVAGMSMQNPGLAYRGARLYSAVAFTLLALQVIERDANRRSLAALPLDESFGLSHEAFRRTLEAVAWADLASILPDPRRIWTRRPSDPLHRRA